MEWGCSKCGCLLTVLVGVALLAGRRVAHRGARSLVGVRSTGQERCDAAAGARAAPGRAAGHRQVGRRAYGIIEKRAVSERTNERAHCALLLPLLPSSRRRRRRRRCIIILSGGLSHLMAAAHARGARGRPLRVRWKSRTGSRGVVGGRRSPTFFDRATCPHFFGLKFVQKLVHCCNWLLTETQCKIVSVQQNWYSM